MKRTILSLTTAIALAAPAFAQDNFDSVIADALQTYGYAEENIGTLTDAERAEIYTTATSGDGMEVRQALAGMDLTEVGMPDEYADVEITPETEERVAEVLSTNGYPEGTVDLLTQGEIANIYVTATSGEANELASVLDGLQLAQAQGSASTSVTPDSTQAVIDYMQENGYTQEEISAVSEGDMADIHVAITSGEPSDIESAIEGAIN